MCHVVVIGAGITGVTTAYELSQLGYQVTVVDRHLFPAMETSFANGGQLSACNAEPKIDSAERHEMDVSKICPFIAQSCV